MLKNILGFNSAISRLFQEGASLEALMNKFKPYIAEINNYKYYDEKEFEEKLKWVTEFFDSVQIQDIEESITA